MNRLLASILLAAVLGRHIVAQPDAEAVAARTAASPCINGEVIASTKKCACREGYSGTYPNCQYCPEPQTSVLAADGSRLCACPAAKGLVPSTTPGSPCKCAPGLFPGSAVSNNPDLMNLCSKCTQVGELAVLEKAKKVCGCNRAAGYGLSAFLLYVRTKEWPQTYCIPCITGNRQIDAQGICRCQPGFGIWGNGGPGANNTNYCRACQGPGYKVDQFGWCRCASGYAVDPRTDTCMSCQGLQFTQLPQEGGSQPWNLLQCACATGYVSVTDDTGPMACEKCVGPTTAKSAVVSKKRQCICKDPQKADPPTCSVCKFGYAATQDGWCKRLPECGKTLQIQVWSEEQLPADWAGDAFPESLVEGTEVPAVNATANIPLSIKTPEEWVAAHVPSSAVSGKFAARMLGCLCATYNSGSSLWYKVTNNLNVDVSPASYAATVSVGEEEISPKKNPLPSNSPTAKVFSVAQTCVQIDLRIWSAAAQLPSQLRLDLDYGEA